MTESEKKPNTEIICKGDHREMGLAQGAGMRTKLGKSAEILSRLDPFLRRKPWWLPYGSYKALSQRKARRMLEDPLRKQFPEMVQRLEGIAEGAEINLSELYLTLGDVASAQKYGAQCMTFADRSGYGFQRESGRATYADALP